MRETQFTVSHFKVFAITQEAGAPDQSATGISVSRRGSCSGARAGWEARICSEDSGGRRRTYSVLLAALRKPQSQAQERPIPDRVASTKAFLERSEKRVEAARQAVGRTKEELAKAEAMLEKEEAMLKKGHPRLRQLLEEEKAMASPFEPPPSAGFGVSTEISRMQAIIDSLQGELARLRGSSAVGSGANGDELMSELPHSKKSRSEREWQHAILGFDFRCRCIWVREFFVDVSQEAWTRSVPVYGLTGVRVGEASHPGPVTTRRGSQGTQVVFSKPRRDQFFALSSDSDCEMETASAQPRSLGSGQNPQSQMDLVATMAAEQMTQVEPESDTDSVGKTCGATKSETKTRSHVITHSGDGNRFPRQPQGAIPACTAGDAGETRRSIVSSPSGG